MLRLLDTEKDLGAVGQQMEARCLDNIRPWHQDHVYWDATLLRRLAGEDIDLDAKIPYDVITAAAEHIPGLSPAAVRSWSRGTRSGTNDW